MSNLKFKVTPTYGKLTHAIAMSRKGYATIANNTEAHSLTTTLVGIYYQGNKIAEIDASGIIFTNAGWGTSTTRTRLDLIADANNVPIWFGQKNFAQTLTARKRMYHDETATRYLITDTFRSVGWDRNTDTLHMAGKTVFEF